MNLLQLKIWKSPGFLHLWWFAKYSSKPLFIELSNFFTNSFCFLLCFLLQTGYVVCLLNSSYDHLFQWSVGLKKLGYFLTFGFHSPNLDILKAVAKLEIHSIQNSEIIVWFNSFTVYEIQSLVITYWGFKKCNQNIWVNGEHAEILSHFW